MVPGLTMYLVVCSWCRIRAKGNATNVTTGANPVAAADCANFSKLLTELLAAQITTMNVSLTTYSAMLGL